MESYRKMNIYHKFFQVSSEDYTKYMSNIKRQSGEAQIPGTCAHSLFHPSPMVLVLLSATFPKLYYIVSLNPACSLATLGMRSKMRAKMTFFFLILSHNMLDQKH